MCDHVLHRIDLPCTFSLNTTRPLIRRTPAFLPWLACRLRIRVDAFAG